MASTNETSEVKYTLGFDDDTTQELTIGPFDPQDPGLMGIRDKVMAFNENFTTDTAQLLLSKYGGEWTGINRVRLINTYVETFF